MIFPNSTDSLTNEKCNNILNDFLSKIYLPNFYQKNIFIRLLFNQFLYFHQNYNLDPKILIKNAKKLKMKDYRGVLETRHKIIKNLTDHAIFFTKGFSENIMKSQERTNEILQMEDYNYSNKNSVIHCRNCKGNVKVTEAFYYCSLCNYYICTKCFDNSKPMPNFNSNNNIQFPPNNINNQAPQNNITNMISLFKPI